MISNENTDSPSGVRVKGWKALFLPVENLQSMERLKIDFLVETTTRQRVKTRGKPRNASFWSQRKNSQAVNFAHLAIPCFKRPKEKFTSVQLVEDISKPLLSNPTQKQESLYYQPQKNAPIKGKILQIYHAFVVFHSHPNGLFHDPWKKPFHLKHHQAAKLHCQWCKGSIHFQTWRSYQRFQGAQ